MKKNYMKTLLAAAALFAGSNGVWAQSTETATILSEDYEDYAVGDITSTMQSNGWTFQSRNNKNQITIVQGTSVNTTKYFDFYYPDGGASRNQSWKLNVADALNADNWTFSFFAALNPGTNNSANRFDIVGTSSGKVTTANDEVTNFIFRLAGTAAGSTTYTPTIGKTGFDNITLTSGEWYKFTIQATSINSETKKENLYVKITNYDGSETVFENTVENVDFTSIGTLYGICWNSPRGWSRLQLDDVIVSKEVPAGTCETPSANVTGVDDAARKVSLTCATDGATIYWSETELAADDEGWTEYTSEITTSAATIYIVAKKGTAVSEVASYATGAGEPVKLNVPSILPSLAEDNSLYSITVDASYNKTGVLFEPEATLAAEFISNAGVTSSVDLPFTPTTSGVLTITASAEGYASSEISISLAKRYTKTWQSVDFSSLTGIEAVQNALGDDWTLLDGHGRWASWDTTKDGSYNFYQHGEGGASNFTMDGNLRMREVVVLAEGMGLGRNVTGGEAINVLNTKANEIVAFEIYNGYGKDIAKGENTHITYSICDGTKAPSMSSTNGALLVQAAIFSPSVNVAISEAGFATFSSPYAVRFDNTEVAAYIVEEVEGNQLILKTVNNVPANTGVLLACSEGNYDIPVAASSSTDVSANLLVGVAKDTEITSGYVLQNQEENGLGFYLVTEDNAKTVPAGKAYLNYTEFDAKALYFDGGDATAIEAISALTSDAVEGIYTVGGAKVESLQKGINILKMHNGETKKVIVK